jgi:uncharacterized protein YjiK
VTVEAGPLASLTYDAAYEVFYGTLVRDRSAVVQVTMEGTARVMFTADSQAGAILGGSLISSLHYASNTGTLYVLAAEQGLLFEVMNMHQLTTAYQLHAIHDHHSSNHPIICADRVTCIHRSPMSDSFT